MAVGCTGVRESPGTGALMELLGSTNTWPGVLYIMLPCSTHSDGLQVEATHFQAAQHEAVHPAWGITTTPQNHRVPLGCKGPTAILLLQNRRQAPFHPKESGAHVPR